MSPLNTENQPRMSKIRIIKNLVVISLSFVLLFTGFNGLSALQSTMNRAEGVGPMGQALIYFMFCVSALLFPKYIIQRFGCKYTIIASQVCFIPYIASNFYPHWSVVVPSSLLLGLSAATLWGGQCTYFNRASVLYCSFMDEDVLDGKEMGSEKCESNSIAHVTQISNEDRISTAKTSLQLVYKENGIPNPSLEADFPNKTIGGSCYNDVTFENARNKASRTLQISNEDRISTASPVLQLVDKESTTLSGISNPTFDADVSFKNKEGHNNLTFQKARSKTIRNASLHEITNAQFFGCHSFLYKTAEIWSNLMSYYILKEGNSWEVTADIPCSCGASFCNTESGCLAHNLGIISDDRRYLLSGLCVGLIVIDIVLLLLLLEPIETERKPVKFSFEILQATINQCKRKEQLFLMPLALLIGYLQGFYMADVTKAYIACSWGTYHIGLVTVGYGLFSAIASQLSGWLVKYIGRIPIISFGIMATIGTCILLLVWTPTSTQPFVFYIIASFFGIIIGILWSQIPAFYGVLFTGDEEAAFAGFYTWDGLGWALGFALSNYLCMYIKIYAMIVTSCAGLLGYLVTEREFFLNKGESK